MTARIVVVEDDPSVAELVTLYLRNAEFIVAHARTAAEARVKFDEEKPALVILDLGLPDANGLELLREIRKHADTPVLALTARAEDVQKIEALESGMDDYMTKPFNPKELVARVRAILRRTAGMPGSGRTIVTKREADDRYALGETEVELAVDLAPEPETDALAELLALAERDCFVGSSLTAEPSYRWVVGGRAIDS